MVHFFWLFFGGRASQPASQGGGRGGDFQSLPATQPRLGAAPFKKHTSSNKGLTKLACKQLGCPKLAIYGKNVTLTMMQIAYQRITNCEANRNVKPLQKRCSSVPTSLATSNTAKKGLGNKTLKCNNVSKSK